MCLCTYCISCYLIFDNWDSTILYEWNTRKQEATRIMDVRCSFFFAFCCVMVKESLQQRKKIDMEAHARWTDSQSLLPVKNQWLKGLLSNSHETIQGR